MKNVDLSSFTEEEALKITGDQLERLFKRGINNIRMVTDEDEVLVVHIHSEGQVEDTSLEEEAGVVS
jgi:hypothetical protein